MAIEIAVESDLREASIDATGLHYRDLNERVRELVEHGISAITLDGVNGQRYIGDGLVSDVRITINGVPGNDLGAFMDGPTIMVNDNAQDGVGNTMNSGKIIVRGHAGDVIGYGMRGGRIFVGGDIGYRVGIHMKSYREQVPIVVAGGNAGDFFGEYMAGGVLMLLGLDSGEAPVLGQYAGTGMHGGTIYVRGDLREEQLGREVRIFEMEEGDVKLIDELLEEFSLDLGLDLDGIGPADFLKLRPFSNRPYGNMYVY